jgi:hypothetical protein
MATLSLFAVGALDRTWSISKSLGAESVPRPPRLYDEIWRVLAPSGLFVNADKYAQTVEAHQEALRWQLNRLFDVFVPRQRYDLLREWVLHYVEDEAAGRVMPEADAITRLNDLGFADVRIAYRRYMDAVLIAHKP